MRFRLNEPDKQSCDCLHNNIVVESLVVALTLVSGLAITGENLITFNLITVPQYRGAANITNFSGNNTGDGIRAVTITENINVKNIISKVFHYTSLGIAGLFFVEIFLKVCTLQRKFLTNPWQIFDAVVVVVALTLELVFHFVIFHERALSSLTYIVLLRLWRLPTLCNIRANAIQEASDCDNELYRSGRLKAEEKCRILEHTISQQTETIRKLERLLHNISGSKQSDSVNGYCQSSQLLHRPHDVTDTFTTKYESTSSFTLERSSHSNLLKSSQKQSNNVSLNCSEPQFVITSDAEIPPSQGKLQIQPSEDVREKKIITENTKSCENNINSTSNSHEAEEYATCDSDYLDREVATTNRQTLPCSESSNTSLMTSSQQSHILMRQRKRRSSASEILDYSCPDIDSVFYEVDKKSLCQIVSLDHDKSFAKDIHEKNFADTTNVTDDNSDECRSNHDSVNKLIPVVLDDKKYVQDRKRTRRFVSCPEYVYTQRMNITNDESLLIGDDHSADDHMAYNNPGFEFGDNVLLQVMAEYDGTKTYRNEDGIPMTSL